jgi:hypothetical protein
MARRFEGSLFVGRYVRVLGDGVAAGLEVHLFINVADVCDNRGHADLESFGDFLVKIASGVEVIFDYRDANWRHNSA